MPRTDVESLRAITAALCCAIAAGAGCAGELENPERFEAVLAQFGDAGLGGAGGSAGVGGSSGAAGTSASGSGASGGTMSMAMGDGGTPMSGEAPPMCVLQVFTTSCGSAGCHDRMSLVLDLVSPGVQSRLLDKKSTSSLCKDRTFIDSSGGASLLIDKLEATPPCGTRMPLIGTLTTAQRTCLESWVSELGGKP